MPERTYQLVLVDYDDREIGTADKQEAHCRPLLHRAFSVFLVDQEGRILLQKRAEGKYHSGGFWANACCSHPRAGEELLPSAEARLHEELGMSCPLWELGSFIYCHRFAEDLCEYELDHVLLGRYSGNFTPDPDEIEELRWVTQEELKEELLHCPEHFAVWFFTAAQIVLRALGEHASNP